MKLSVYIKPGSKHEGLAWDGERIVARVSAIPKDDEANKRLVEVLAAWLRLPKNKVQIASGRTARYKTIQIDAEVVFVKDQISKLEQLPSQTSLLA